MNYKKKKMKELNFILKMMKEKENLLLVKKNDLYMK